MAEHDKSLYCAQCTSPDLCGTYNFGSFGCFLEAVRRQGVPPAEDRRIIPRPHDEAPENPEDEQQ